MVTPGRSTLKIVAWNVTEPDTQSKCWPRKRVLEKAPLPSTQQISYDGLSLFWAANRIPGRVCNNNNRAVNKPTVKHTIKLITQSTKKKEDGLSHEVNK